MQTKRFILALIILAFMADSSAHSSGSVPEISGEHAAIASNAVEVFVTSWCPYCKKLESFLKQKRISYLRYDIESNDQASEIFSKLGGSGVPMTRINRRTIVQGYDPEGILEALRVK